MHPTAFVSRNWKRWICLCAVICLITGGNWAYRSWKAANIDSLTPTSQTVFHTAPPAEGVTVPFQLYNGLIFVKANIDGKEAPCMVDTGSNATLSGTSAAIAGRSLNQQNSVMDGVGRTKTYQKRLLSSVRLGDFEVRNVRGWRVLSPPSPAEQATAPDLPVILGNAFFKDTVMTIDYRMQTLRLCPSTVHPQTVSQQPGDIALDFNYDGVSLPDRWGLLSVDGTIEGRPVRFIIDTGWSLQEIGLSSSVFTELLPNQKRVPETRTFIFGNSTVDTIQHVHYKLGEVIMVGPVLESEILNEEHRHPDGVKSDVILGSVILQGFKVTIDYPAHRLYLQMDKTEPQWKPSPFGFF